MRISHNRLRQMVKEEYTQAARSTGVISESKLRYKLYEAALETGLSSSQYHALMSEGIFSWIKDALIDIGAGKELAGDLKKMFADKKNQVIYKKATEEIQKNVAELFKAGAAAGVDKEALKDWLVAGINKITEETAASSPGASGSPTSGPDEVKPGTPIDASNPETAIPALTNAGAEAAGVDRQKAAQNVANRNLDVIKLSQVLAKAIAQKANVDAGLAAKVIGWLMQNNHMVAESGGHITAQHILKAAKSSLRNLSTANSGVLLERWNKLAGLLNEADADEKKTEEAKKKFGDFLDDLQKSLSIKDADAEQLARILVALDDLESIKLK